jgi:hypothetical protein
MKISASSSVSTAGNLRHSEQVSTGCTELEALLQFWKPLSSYDGYVTRAGENYLLDGIATDTSSHFLCNDIPATRTVACIDDGKEQTNLASLVPFRRRHGVGGVCCQPGCVSLRLIGCGDMAMWCGRMVVVSG